MFVWFQGPNCDFKMCKPCCKKIFVKEQRDCLGHKFSISERNERARKYKEKNLKNVVS